MKVLITRSSHKGKGGVANFYNAVSPHLYKMMNNRFVFLEIGSTEKIGKLFHPFWDQIRFFEKVSRGKFDLVHVNPSLNFRSFLRDGTIVYLAKKRNMPVIVFFRGWNTAFEKTIESKLWWFFEKTFLKADMFIVLASEFKDKLAQWGVKVPIYCGTTAVDDKLLGDFSISDKINMIQREAQTRILFLSRVEKEKGVFEAIEAVKILQERGHAVSLSIAGDGSAMRGVKKGLAIEEYSHNNITLLGYVRGDRKREVLKSHHVYCLPTYYPEGMPNSVLEAMTFGMPVLTRPVGGIKDFFQNGKMGFLTESKNPEILADLLELMITDKEKMSNMAFYNHCYAKENLLASKVAKDLVYRYERLLKRVQNS